MRSMKIITTQIEKYEEQIRNLEWEVKAHEKQIVSKTELMVEYELNAIALRKVLENERAIRA